MAAWETCEQIRKKNWMNALPLTQQRPITGRKKPFFNIGVNIRAPLDLSVNAPRKRSWVEKFSQINLGSWLWVKIWSTIPAKVVSVHILLTWDLVNVEEGVVLDLFDANKFLSCRKVFQLLRKPLLMFASAPVLSEPDWMLMHDSWSLSGFVVNSRNNAKLCKGFPRGNVALKTFG